MPCWNQHVTSRKNKSESSHHTESRLRSLHKMNNTMPFSVETLLRQVDDYVLFSLPRSGSTTLCSRLGSLPSVSCFHELLNFHGNNTGAYWWHVTRGNGTTSLPPSTDESRCAFVNRVRHLQPHPESSFGFKVFDHHVDDPHRFLHLLEHTNARRVGCVVLRRTNVTARYLSWTRAKNTGCWGTTPSEQHKRCRPWSGSVDVRALKSFQTSESHWFKSVTHACANRPTSHVSFEDLTGAHQSYT